MSSAQQKYFLSFITNCKDIVVRAFRNLDRFWIAMTEHTVYRPENQIVKQLSTDTDYSLESSMLIILFYKVRYGLIKIWLKLIDLLKDLLKHQTNEF